tara:strand:- start:446 stop:1171 length:726 start_codon:yes stop_codon:yes gene_type:complete
MAFGKLKCDTILYTNNQGAETPITVEDLATAANGINTNSGNITTNATNIATNTTDIATNTTNITTNTTNIATNTTAIGTKMPSAGGTFTGDVSFDGEAIVRGDTTNGSGKITLNCENNSHGVKIKGPAHSAGATYTLTLPDTAGTTGYALTTDGSGGLSWADYLPKAGGTVNGNLEITGNLTGVGNIIRTGNITLTGSLGVSGHIDLPGTDPQTDNQAARKAYVDSQVASKASIGVALALG